MFTLRLIHRMSLSPSSYKQLVFTHSKTCTQIFLWDCRVFFAFCCCRQEQAAVLNLFLVEPSRWKRELTKTSCECSHSAFAERGVSRFFNSCGFRLVYFLSATDGEETPFQGSILRYFSYSHLPCPWWIATFSAFAPVTCFIRLKHSLGLAVSISSGDMVIFFPSTLVYFRSTIWTSIWWACRL